MPNLLARGQTALSSRWMPRAAGVAVSYERPGQFLLAVKSDGSPLTARPGDESATAQPVGAPPKPRREDAERDYLFAVADLVSPQGAFLPRKGDRVHETLNGVGHVFEVTPRDGEPAWRYSDRQRTDVRLHTKRVA